MKDDRIEITNRMEQYLIDKGVYENVLEERTYSDRVLNGIPDNLRDANEEAEKEKEREKKKEKMREKMREKMKEKKESDEEVEDEELGGEFNLEPLGDEEIG